MNDMHVMTAVLASALVCCSAPAVAHTSCNPTNFGQPATLACDRTAKGCLLQFKYAPAEIRSIVRGAAMTWVGFLSPGPATYVALDISNQRALKVQIYCPLHFNPHPPRPPQIKSPTPDNYETSVPGANGMSCVKHVRILPLSLHQATSLACSLNPFWSKSFKPYEDWHVTDVGSTVWILGPQKAKEGIVAGVFTGPVANFGKLLLKLFADTPSATPHPATASSST